MHSGSVISLCVTPEARAPMVAVREVRAVPGKGLEGDRYYMGAGTWSGRGGPDREVTLIEIEAIEALHRDYGVTVAPDDARRNIITRGITLNHLVGRTLGSGKSACVELGCASHVRTWRG